ncbi:DUF4251 domain-containing protein [Carboxylicivirga taeanensis]|uniref:DUF4251 domain-containing protein n=1 Tax=Carboxylicivirga taeanensis TaxID=1416875 RepID=UPI003F6DFB56
MKSIFSIITLSLILLSPTFSASAQKKNKKERQQEQFIETQKLVNSKQFIFVPDRAFPQGGRSIDLTTNYGFVKVEGTETTGDLPYFGRAYSVPYGGGSGIKFETTSIKNEQIEINEKKMRISYSFEARSKEDTYSLKLDIGYNGNASLSVMSNNRSHISYNGQVSELKEEETK